MAKRTTIYFDEKVHKKAVSLAKKEGRSLSNYITCLLLAAIERDNMFSNLKSMKNKNSTLQQYYSGKKING